MLELMPRDDARGADDISAPARAAGWRASPVCGAGAGGSGTTGVGAVRKLERGTDRGDGGEGGALVAPGTASVNERMHACMHG